MADNDLRLLQPGPCPPCQVPLVIPCPSHKKDLVVKCSLAKGKDVPVPACEEPCEKLLACQAHACDKLCHDGDCAKCTAKETVRCYCGVDEREVDCGWRKREGQTCGDGNDTWEGRFGCERVCARPYDCGNHTCQEVRFGLQARKSCYMLTASLLICRNVTRILSRP